MIQKANDIVAMLSKELFCRRELILRNLPSNTIRYSTIIHSREKYIEDIYSFAVNTINIVIECNENIIVFSRMRSTSENLNVFIT